MKNLIALLAGIIFGAGLVFGGMTDPAKVVAFLDITGRWDPSLGFVMGVALCVTIPTYRLLVPGRTQPLFEKRFYLPTKTDLDTQLIGGAALFGAGWGLAGFCPGPAIASLHTGNLQIFAFVAAMIAGMWLRNKVSGASNSASVTPADEMAPTAVR